MKIDLKKFQELVDQKYISVQKHEIEDLLIWNYSHKCQFDRFWTPETMMARGLITDLAGNIKARAFSKFFNYEEHVGQDSKLPPLPVEAFEVTDKLDGSLGILYHLSDGTPQIATRGSFTSEQANKANEILKKRLTVEPTFKFQEGFTYLWEIIYPQNRIVIDYGGKEDLILLAIIDNETGQTIDPTLFSQDLFPVVDRFDGITDLSKLKQLQKDNKEGFVIHFTLSDIRVKIKFEEYVRLHRLVTGVNAKRIWEHLMNNESLQELLERVPDEFYKWVKDTQEKLQWEFNLVEDLVSKEYDKIKNLPTRKDQAIALQKNKYAGIIFAMLDKKDYARLIWKMIRPVAEKPYKEDIDA